MLRALDARDAYFWATHQGAELDLLLFHGGKRIGIEIKRADASVIAKSMQIALTDLQLDRLLVLYPGEKAYTLDERVDVLPVAAVADWTPKTRLWAANGAVHVIKGDVPRLYLRISKRIVVSPRILRSFFCNCLRCLSSFRLGFHPMQRCWFMRRQLAALRAFDQ